MAIALDTVTQESGTNPGTTYSWNHTCNGTNKILFVCARNGGGEGERISGITYDGISMTRINAFSVGGGESTVVLYYLVNPATGLNSVVITSASGLIAGSSVSYTGASQSGVPDSSNTGGVLNQSSFSLSTTTVADKCWLVMAAVGNLTTKEEAAGTTTRAVLCYDSNSAKTPPGSKSLGFTGGDEGTDMSAVIASFAPFVATETVDQIQGYFNV